MNIMNLMKSVMSILLFLTSQASGRKCDNYLICKRNEVKVINKEGICLFECQCKPGYMSLPNGLDGCNPCKTCTPPMVVLKNCTINEETTCGPCEKGHYYSLGTCEPCTQCENGVLSPCTALNDTKCKAQPVCNCTVTPPSPSALYEEESTSTCKSDLFRVVIPVIAVLELIIIFIFSTVCWFVWPIYRRKYRLYRLADASLLATNSVSTLGPRNLGLLTSEERETLIRNLPGTYLEELGKLLNPNCSVNNWVALAGVLRFTRGAIENIRASTEKYPTFTQDLLHEWGSRNVATVEALGRALISIQREDAASVLLNYVISLRPDNISITSSIIEDGVSEISTV